MTITTLPARPQSARGTSRPVGPMARACLSLTALLVAIRLYDAAGPRLLAQLMSDPRALLDAAQGIADLARLTDAELAGELYWHGHYDPREG